VSTSVSDWVSVCVSDQSARASFESVLVVFPVPSLTCAIVPSWLLVGCSVFPFPVSFIDRPSLTWPSSPHRWPMMGTPINLQQPTTSQWFIHEYNNPSWEEEEEGGGRVHRSSLVDRSSFPRPDDRHSQKWPEQRTDERNGNTNTPTRDHRNVDS
jgi:hypothetical protein